MNLHDIPVTAKQCKGHMSVLLDKFRNDYDRRNKTGSGGPEFEYYDEMMNIFEGCPSLEPPVSVSAGRGLTFSKNGVKEVEHQQHSRTRPKSEQQRKLEANSKKATSTNPYSTLPGTKSRNAEDRVADEVKRMTDIYEHESNRKYKLFERMVLKMEDLKPSSKGDTSNT